jgi:hypothetical protein
LKSIFFFLGGQIYTSFLDCKSFADIYPLAQNMSENAGYACLSMPVWHTFSLKTGLAIILILSK